VTYYIGLISGTSMDGIDAVLASFSEDSVTVEGTHARAYPDVLRRELLAAAAEPQSAKLADYGRLHMRVAQEFAAATQDLLAATGKQAAEVQAIGSHGQTLLHAPDADPPFSLQAGDPGALATFTGIPVVADFRNTDLALGGQGAPLVPAFHQFAFGTTTEDRALVNIGGIANITLLPGGGPVTGFDTGPGNTLLDDWYRRHHSDAFDRGGNWAAGGTVHAELLVDLQSDPYFAAAPPKSTGTDYFCSAWLDQALARLDAAPGEQDTQATLAELSAASIADALATDCTTPLLLAVCGGGAHNADLVARLRRRLPGTKVDTTARWGVDPDWVEAMAFAWLARERLAGRPGNLPTVTGATAAAALGGVYLPPGHGSRHM
jgi:anhydro-N-acetylmuramic acid kinase